MGAVGAEHVMPCELDGLLQAAWQSVKANVRARGLLGALALWPRMRLYDKQRAIVQSVEENAETFVVAGNQLGKDFVAGFIVVAFFLRSFLRGRTCRIVTTSATEDHLDVLWAEIGDRLSSSALPLLVHRGGPFVAKHHHLRLASSGWDGSEGGLSDVKSYAIGKVTKSDTRGEGLSGHHAQDTLAIGDEASGLSDVAYAMFQGWARQMLFIGNPNECSNFFKRGVKEGDVRT